METTSRARLGVVLVVLGIAGILWGVFHVLNAIPRPEQLDFAHRTTDREARSAVHETFLGGLVRALLGLGIAIAGAHLRSRALRDADRG